VKEIIETRPWDVLDYLKTQEDINAYVEIAFEMGGYKHIARALFDAARAQEKIGIANETVPIREQMYTNFCENENPTLNVLTEVIDSLGYRLSIVPKNSKQPLAV